MARVTDVVCGMTVDTDTAPARSSYEGRSYYFCSTVCKKEFDEDPSRYVSRSATAPRGDALPADAPVTQAGGLTAPKFGSAGSGGAEYENRPLSDRDRESDAR